jgi:hypothetical protein
MRYPSFRLSDVAAVLAITAMPLLISGCVTRPDWIESTLVTADVTGVWRGAVSNVPSTNVSNRVVMILQQQGGKVTGRLEAVRYSGPIEGTIQGDKFSFAATFSSIKGEAIVSSDEMAGQMIGPDLGSGTNLFLQRAASSDADPGNP